MFVYTGYLDESGTHEGSPVTVMGGVLGRAEQREQFEQRFSWVQAEVGFRVWHTKKFRKRAGHKTVHDVPGQNNFVGEASNGDLATP
jgi:hypothetical protein